MLLTVNAVEFVIVQDVAVGRAMYSPTRPAGVIFVLALGSDVICPNFLTLQTSLDLLNELPCPNLFPLDE